MRVTRRETISHGSYTEQEGLILLDRKRLGLHQDAGAIAQITWIMPGNNGELHR